jgi:hypothetical protein
MSHSPSKELTNNLKYNENEVENLKIGFYPNW